MLISETLFGIRDKVQEAIALLKKHEPPEGYYLAFSGGKDSVCIYRLAEMAGVKFDAHYNVTTVDYPETVRFIKNEYPLVKMDLPTNTMWQLISKDTMPPTRIARYCCRWLKERGGRDRSKVTGIRKQESSSRNGRNEKEEDRKTGKDILNPIFYWNTEEVWEFIETQGLKYCSLYDDPGFSRIGCILCPNHSTILRKYEAERYPKFYSAYLRSFDRMLVNRKERGKTTEWKSSQEVMDWWLNQ